MQRQRSCVAGCCQALETCHSIALVNQAFSSREQKLHVQLWQYMCPAAGGKQLW